jgi:hypothetical protein
MHNFTRIQLNEIKRRVLIASLSLQCEINITISKITLLYIYAAYVFCKEGCFAAESNLFLPFTFSRKSTPVLLKAPKRSKIDFVPSKNVEKF